jgi:subtilisin family serine protease
MRWRSSAIKSIVVVTLLLLVLPGALQAKADSDGGNEKEIITTTKLLVKYKATSNDDNNLRTSTTNSNSNDGYVHQLLGSRVRSIANLSVKGHLALIDVDNEQKELVIQELMADNNVLHVEEDFEIRKTPAIEDEEGGGHEKDTITNLRRSLEELQQYGNKLIQADDVWATVASHPNEPVKVCIIDTGYNINHEDLPHSGVSQTDVGYGSSFLDMDGHGTHCAGVIGAIGNNQLGIVGVNPDYTKFSFHIVKALSDEGVGTASAVLRAIQGCIDGGSKIISMSIGGGPNSAIFRDEYERAYDEGVLLVSASGNQGQPIHDYPASYPTVISVGAVDQNGNRAEFSNYSDQLELMAPGVSIKSTYLNSGYRSLSGTSMATPYVAGAFALVWGYFPKCSNHQIRNVFARTARSISKDASGCDEMNGFGIIQAKAAFDALNQYGCEYGGDDSIPRSLGAIGGCEQTRILTAKTLPPSSSPTEKPTSPPFTIHFFTNSPTEQSTSVSPPTSLFTLPIMFPKPLDNPTNSPTYSVSR